MVSNNTNKIPAIVNTSRTTPYFFKSTPLELFVLLGFLIPGLFVVVVALLHTLSYLIYLTGDSLFTLVLPAAAMVFASLVPVLLNPVHSLLCLLGLFAATALIYLSQGAEYLALVFLIVYVGALAILFLFVIMLLNVKDIMSSRKAARFRGAVYFAVGVFGYLLFIRLILILHGGFQQALLLSDDYLHAFPTVQEEMLAFAETDILGLRGLYIEHWPLFGLITALLLLAMLGAIILATASVEADEKKDGPENEKSAAKPRARGCVLGGSPRKKKPVLIFDSS